MMDDKRNYTEATVWFTSSRGMVSQNIQISIITCDSATLGFGRGGWVVVDQILGFTFCDIIENSPKIQNVSKSLGERVLSCCEF